MPTIRVSETYDLSTEVDKMGIIGIHTPSTKAIRQLYPGLFMNFRYMKLVGCDVTIACASMLPADPLQIGTESGSIAPQDMFNPILFKAVSNDSFNTLQARIYGGAQPVGDLGSVDETGVPELVDTPIDNFAVYYALLADPDGWRKAMPQAGLEMHGLYPIVYQVMSNYGNQGTPSFASSTVTNALTVSDLDTVSTGNKGAWLKGPSMKMPRLPTMVSAFDPTSQAGTVPSANQFPTTYVACIVTPPAKLNKLYYRMKVTWTVEFDEVRPVTDLMTFTDIAGVGDTYYASDYVDQSSKMTATTDMVDTDSISIEKVMTSTR